MSSERLPFPPFLAASPIFPFEGDIVVKELADRLEDELPRSGEPGGAPCEGCAAGASYIWSNERWAVARVRFGGLHNAPFPGYMLRTIDHLDFGDMTDAVAAEFGVLSLRIERALDAFDDVGRVHIYRYGDGGEHLHVWFMGRPKGAWQFSGYALALWGFTLPPLDDATASAHDDALARTLKRTIRV